MSRPVPAKDPFALFEEVFQEAEALGIDEPNAMVLSSVGDDGRPSSRVVLLKAFDRRGFVFYTNFESRKGREILAHPDVSLNFYWRELGKQIRIEGRAEPVADEEADAYFATRDHSSQVGAWASRQSRPMTGRAALLSAAGKVKLRYPGKVPRPPHWSGFRVVPSAFELWVKGIFRLHDRTVFEKEGDGWRSYKVFP